LIFLKDCSTDAQDSRLKDEIDGKDQEDFDYHGDYPDRDSTESHLELNSTALYTPDSEVEHLSQGLFLPLLCNGLFQIRVYLCIP
jgi:hypothetical protein